MQVCVTVDLDNYREYHRLLGTKGDGTAHSFYDDAVPRFLDLLDRNQMRATFFAIGCDAAEARHRQVLRQINARGHEIGNHSYTHPYNFRQLPRVRKEAEIDQAEAAIADAVGQKPVGFRTPSCDLDGEILSLLTARGYLYESSVYPSPIMWAFMLYGKLFVRHKDYQLGHLSAPLAPREPYVPNLEKIHRRRPLDGLGEPPIIEIPFSVLPLVGIPFYSTLLRTFGPAAFTALTRLYGKRRALLHTLFHLIELADFTDTPLGEDYKRMPALSVPLPSRQCFVASAMRDLAAAGNVVTLREFATSYRERLMSDRLK
jgi:peptidoglycan-N-acetylglucosamine deacetylase